MDEVLTLAFLNRKNASIIVALVGFDDFQTVVEF
jgi:hypothetical protein